MSKPDGGPAFPDQEGSGMSLRAWLAGQALIGLLSTNQAITMNPDGDKKTTFRSEDFAEMSVFMADAMLAELEKEGK